MSREVRRVPLDFDWPIGEVWKGYITPAELIPPDCTQCEGSGYSPMARTLYAQWHGNAPFTPEVPLTAASEEVQAVARRNVESAPEFYGTGPLALLREAQRLCALFNGQWMHHLSQEDVDALIEAGHLRDLTHTWSKESGWVAIEPPVHPTAEQVNARTITHSLFFLGSIACHTLIQHRCEKAGRSHLCAVCEGRGSVEAYPGQQEAYESHEWTEPPTGEGWQFWETVSEGSPLSPVFATSEELVDWLVNVGAWNHKYSRAAAEAICREGSSLGTMIVVNGEVIDGVEALVRMEVEG